MDNEIKFRLQEKRISDSRLISLCRDVAQQLGDGRKTSEEWANAEYVFNGEDLVIDYKIFAMGDQTIMVAFEGREVFKAKERVNTPLNPSRLNVTGENGRRFEIQNYDCGLWETRVRELYETLECVVPQGSS